MEEEGEDLHFPLSPVPAMDVPRDQEGGDMASPDPQLGTKPLQKKWPRFRSKVRARHFSRAGPAFIGFKCYQPFNLRQLQLYSVIEPLEFEEKHLEKELLTISGLSCIRCTLTFSTADHLKNHNFFCGNPNFLAGDLKILKKHVDLFQDNCGMFFCPWCPILCLNIAALFKHVQSCREARRERDERKILKKLPCPECATDFSHLQKLSNHMQSHYVADFSCRACNETFPSANFLAKHLVKCTSKGPYKCCDCNRTFTSTKAIRLHVLSCRTTVQCLKCAKYFPGKFLCVEHIVMHIFSEWAKIGLQMFDGVLYKIKHHKLPDEELFPMSTSPCASPEPDPAMSQETHIKTAHIKTNSKPKAQELRNELNKNKVLTGGNLPRISLSEKPVLTAALDTNLMASDGAAKPYYTLKTKIGATTSDPPMSIIAPKGMLLTDEDNLSVIENEVYEIEHTLDVDEFLSEPDTCDSERPLPTTETCERLTSSIQTNVETQGDYLDVGQLFTPAIDNESGDGDKLTLTIVNVEGSANLFDWDDCDSEDVSCGATDIYKPQTEKSDLFSPEEIRNNAFSSENYKNDVYEEGDSGIGATDDSHSYRDRSEVPDKFDDAVPKHREVPPECTEKAEETSYPLTFSEMYVASPSCDTEIVVETSPITELETTEFSLVVPKRYSVLAEHCYASPYLIQNAANGTIKTISATEAARQNRKSGISSKAGPKLSSKNGDDTIELADESAAELDPLQKILQVMSKEARQNITKKHKSVKHTSASKKCTLIKPSHTVEELPIRLPLTVHHEEPSNTETKVPGNNTSLKNAPMGEDYTISDRSVSDPQLSDTHQSTQAISNGSDEHMVQQKKVPQSEQPRFISNKLPPVSITQKIISRDDFMERVKPPISLNKMQRKECSMSRHGFKQIATVFPQRKEQPVVQKASIPSSSASAMHVKPSNPISTLAVSAQSTPPHNIPELVSPAVPIVVNFAPNAAPRISTAPRFVSPVVPSTSHTIVTKLMPNAAPRISTANSNSTVQRPVQYTLQFQKIPHGGVPPLIRISDVMLKADTTNNAVNESSAPQTSTVAQKVPSQSFPKGHTITSTFTGNASSGIGSRPVFARIPPTNCSTAAANVLDGCGTSLPDTNLNLLPSENTKDKSKENLPPVNETSDTSSVEPESELKKESTMFQLASNNGTNDNCVPLTKSSLPAMDLLHESGISLLDSSLNSLLPKENLSSKENLLPAQDIGNMPSSGPVIKLKRGSQPLECSKVSDDINQLAPEKIPETKPFKAIEQFMPTTTKCKLVDEEVNHSKEKIQSRISKALSPDHSCAGDFAADMSECKDSALDHRIKALISCLDNTIACEEIQKPEDIIVNSEKQPRIEAPSTENCEAVSKSSGNETIKNIDAHNEVDQLAQSKPFQVCHMQLCDSTEQEELAAKSSTQVESPTEDAKLPELENAVTTMKSRHTLMSHFQTNLCVSRKLLSEMKCFKRKRYGREGLHRSSSNVIMYNCNHCSQQFYSQQVLESHTCLKAVIKGKFTAEQFDLLIDRLGLQGETKVGGDEVTPKQIECQIASDSSEANDSAYLSYLKMKTTIRNKKFVCEKCKMRCKSFSALLEHKSTAHDEKYSVKCHICSKTFARLQQLAVHVAKKHRAASNPSMKAPAQLLKKPVINSSLSREAALHVVKSLKIRSRFSGTVHKDNRPLVETALPVAEKESPKTTTPCVIEKSDPVQSIPSKETDDPNRDSDSLAKESTLEDECLKETPVVAGNSDPDKNSPTDNVAQCPICSRHFKGKAGLSSHMVQAHRESESESLTAPIEDDPIQCSLCNKPFKGKPGLTSHMNQAHRETFKCPVCFRRFCYIKTLKFHITKDHPSSANFDTLASQSVTSIDGVISPSNPVKCENLQTDKQENVETIVLSSTAENNSGPQSAITKKEVIDHIPLQETKIMKPKKTKWKFVQDTSPQASSSGQDGTISADIENVKKIKKVKWRIVKDESPEKIPSPERPAKSPRLSGSHPEPVPPLVLSLSKIKKHRFKCSICWKQYKKHEHLRLHQMRSHKATSQPQRHSLVDHSKESPNANDEVLAAVDHQPQSHHNVAAPSTTNVEIQDKTNLSVAENNSQINAVVLSISKNVQPSSLTIIKDSSSESGEKSVEEQTKFPPDDLAKEEINSSDPPSAIALEEEQLPSPLEPNLPSGKLKCEICQIEFSTKGYLEHHNIKIHSAPCNFTCPFCDKIFVDIRSLRFHKNLKHKNGNKGENPKLESKLTGKTVKQCDECNKEFKYHADLRKHKRKVHKTPHHLQCPICRHYFRSKMLLATHKYKAHGDVSDGGTPPSLSSPSKSNNDNQEVENNLIVDSNLTPKTAEVDNTTEQKIEEPEALQDKLEKCVDCSLTFDSVSSLKSHRISIHADKAIHSCDVCGKRYSYAGSLKHHIANHYKIGPSEPERKSRRSLTKNCLEEKVEETGSKFEEREVDQNTGTPPSLEEINDLPIIPSSNTIDKNEESGCHAGDSDKSDKPEEKSKEKRDQDTSHNIPSQIEDLQHSPIGPPSVAENLGHQELGPFAMGQSGEAATFNSESLENGTVPTENDFSNKHDNTPVMPPGAVGPSSDVTDHQWSSSPQLSQHQVPAMPHLAPVPVEASFDKLQSFHSCTLCGLCLPSWYALQEHYYMFHSHPNYFAAPSLTPASYAAPLGYSAVPAQIATCNNWTPAQHQLTNLSSGAVYSNGPNSFQELSGHSGAHCSVCGLAFPSIFALQEHYATHMAAPKAALQSCAGFY